MNEKLFNLDKLGAELAQNMVVGAKEPGVGKKPVDTLERLVTKTLAVLQEQGVYAAILFLFSRTGDEAKIAPKIRAQLFNAVKRLPIFAENTDIPSEDAHAPTALRFYSDNVLGDIDTLLLIRDLYEQTLIYARYGAKAAGGD